MTEGVVDALAREGLIRGPYHAYPFPFVREGLPWLIDRLGWKGKLVVMPAFICPALVEAVLVGGAVPALVDVDARTWLIDVESAPLPWDRVAAVLAVHTLGNLEDVGALTARVHRFAPQARVIEDAAHSLFATQAGAVIPWSGEVVFVSLYKQLGYPYGALILSRTELDGAGSGWTGRPDDRPLREDWLKSLPERLTTLRKTLGPRTALISAWKARWPHASWASFQQPLTSRGGFPGDLISWELTSRYSGSRDALVQSLRARGVMADTLWWDAPVVSARYQAYVRGECAAAQRLARRVVNVHVESSDIGLVLERITQVFQDGAPR